MSASQSSLSAQHQAFERECDDVDALLTHLGLDPESCRTDGGGLNLSKIKSELSGRTMPEASAPAPARRKLWDAFNAWAQDHLGQGYSIESDEGCFIDPVTRWCFAGYRAGVAAQSVERLASERPFQERVHDWMLVCFGTEQATNAYERCNRFLEEALELVQSCGATEADAMALVAYVFSRPAGEMRQEAGAAKVTLAALCSAKGIPLRGAGEAELIRVWTMVDKLRAKHAAKPKNSPLAATTQ